MPLHKVMILGIGGGGGRIVRAIADRDCPDWIDLVYADTDVDDLDYCQGVLHVPLGQEWTHGLGTGGDPTTGRHAASAHVAEFRDMLRAPDLLIVVGCLGGGTGSGGVQVIANLAREEDKLAFFFVTLPFANEGNRPRDIADRELETLRQHCDVVIAVQNDLVFTHFPADIGVNEARTGANKLLADGLLGIANLLRCKGMMPVDFASLRSLLRRKEAICSFGIGYGCGENRGVEAIDDLFHSPMLGGREFVDRADAVVASLLGGQDMRIGELNECLRMLNEQLPARARTVVGADTLPTLGDTIQLTVLAIHYTGRSRGAGTAATVVPEPRPARSPRGGRNARTDDKQGTLPFVEENCTVGIFGDCQPTIYQGENLDIPTFRRRGQQLEVEE